MFAAVAAASALVLSRRAARQAHGPPRGAAEPRGTPNGAGTTKRGSHDSCMSWRMPGEWELHAQTWMGFPTRLDVWPDEARPAQHAFAAVAAAIARFEPVTVCAPPGAWSLARSMLPSHVRVVEMSQDDAWFRDTASTFVVGECARSGERHACATSAASCCRGAACVRGVDWDFNAWGEVCYGTYDADKLVGRKVCALERVSVTRPGMVLEGGSIHVDGQGTLLTTSECLLNPNRNPNLRQSDIQDQLCRHLGVTTVIWLPLGVQGDVDTSGHVDNMACFLRPGVVALHWTDDKSDPQYVRAHTFDEVRAAGR